MVSLGHLGTFYGVAIGAVSVSQPATAVWHLMVHLAPQGWAPEAALATLQHELAHWLYGKLT